MKPIDNRIISGPATDTNLSNTLSELIRRCDSALTVSQIRQLQSVLECLHQGVCVFALGAVKVKRAPDIVRIKVGRNHRLLIQVLDGGLVFKELVSRQGFERFLNRRR